MRSALAVFLVAAACGSSTPAVTQGPPPPPDRPDPAPPVVEAPPADKPTKPITNTTLAAIGLDPAALDRNADPCDDFYQFACGGWIKSTQIQPDLPLAMRSFVDIELRNETYLHEVLENLAKDPGTDPVAKKVGDYYAACMDEAAIEKAGIKPIAPLLAQANKISDAKSLSAMVATLAPIGMNSLFMLAPMEDFADATKMIAGIDQGGLGLPNRDYYLTDDAKSKELRAAYVETSAAVLVEAGHKKDVAKKEAEEILALETEIAKAHKDKVALRDPKGIYNRLDRAGVEKAMPSFAWGPYFKAIGQVNVTAISVSAPEFLSGLEALIKKTPMSVWRNYSVLRIITGSARFLTKKLEDLGFELEKKLSGATEQRSRWKRCVGQTTDGLGEALGQIYVRDKFPGASKKAAEEQVHAIVEAMNKNIDSLPWMDATTKTKAHQKAAALAYQIGYPNKWREYKFKIGRGTWGANVLAAAKETVLREASKIGKPVDRGEWGLAPSAVNAYYNPLRNLMVFPAGILQTPFYQVDRTVAVNLGGMGMVVGHELTHGFDDQGAQFDAKGNMSNWWAPETEKQFKARTQCVIDQYSAYPAGGGKVNGSLTVGENIADIGGLKLALAGYRALRASSPNTDVADGFTEDQQFFLSFGQTWCAKMRPEYEAMLVSVDSHSPAQWRVNGTLAASPDFAKAFRCKLGAKLKPKNACVVW